MRIPHKNHLVVICVYRRVTRARDSLGTPPHITTGSSPVRGGMTIRVASIAQ